MAKGRGWDPAGAVTPEKAWGHDDQSGQRKDGGGGGGGFSFNKESPAPAEQAAFLADSNNPRTIPADFAKYFQSVLPAGFFNNSQPYTPPPHTRFMPDVALLASPAAAGGSGTSAAAPKFAALVALANQLRAGQGLTPLTGSQLLGLLYTAPASVFNDVTAGQSSDGKTYAGNGFPAGPGFDLATGRGSPNAAALITWLSAPKSTTTQVTAKVARAAQGQNTLLTATVKAAAPIAGPPSGKVAFFAGGRPLGTAALNASGVATLSTKGLGIGRHSVTARYVGNGPHKGSASPARAVHVAPPALLARLDASPERRFVRQLFADLLRRAPDAATVANLAELIRARRLGYAALAWELVKSEEFRRNTIADLYRDLLGRRADPAAQAHWLGAFALGATPEQVEAGILGSAEFFRRNGAINAGFAQALIQHALHRAAGAGEVRTLTARLAAGASRERVADGVLRGPEAAAARVQEAFQALLRHPAGPRDLARYSARDHLGVESLLTRLSVSPEYLALVGGA